VSSSSRVVYGVNPVREVLAANAKDVSVVYVAVGDTGPALKELRRLCAERRVFLEERERAELDGLAGEGARHQGAVAVCGEYAYADMHGVLDGLAEGVAPLVVVLDGVTDPHNLGAIVRSANVLGAHAVVIPKDRAAAVTPTVVKASAGATEHTPICQVVNLVRALEELKERQVWCAGAVIAADAEPPWRVDWKGAMALVVGAEGKGLRPLVAKTCDLRVAIPMRGQVDSLNVSVATGVLLYEAARQRAGTAKA
jgi:23S rRNA (guanosine2251-2'-O)-methyltransferase